MGGGGMTAKRQGENGACWLVVKEVVMPGIEKIFP